MTIKPNNRRIAFTPFEDPTNNYVARMQFLLSNFGQIDQIRPKNALTKLLKGNLKPYDIVWANWIENGMLKSNGRLSLIKLIVLFTKTFFMVCLAKKSVFVRHNHYPHACYPKHAALSTKIINLYEHMFDVVVTHSGAEVTNHKLYCPHPLYRLIENPNTSQLPSTKLPAEYFIVFGRVLPYKKIEVLIENFPANKVLVVAGSTPNKHYADRLANIKQSNFIFIPGYLSEFEAQKLVAGAKAVVISHSDKNMVASGTFFYAMSLAKPVYTVETDFFKWVKPRISPQLLFLAQDVKSLCSLIHDADLKSDSFMHDQSIQDEFGDQTILKALSEILA